MHRLLQAAILGLACGVATACSAPLKEPNPPSTQSSLESASHWKRVASTTAERMLAGLGQIKEAQGTGYDLGDMGDLGKRPIYIRPVDTGMVFSRAFKDLLTQELLQRGHPVAINPTGAVVVNYDVQVIPHNRPNDDGYHYSPGDFTALTTLGYITWKAATNWEDPYWLAIGPIADLYLALRHYLTDVPNTEIIVTTAVVDSKSYLMRTADIYYVDERDTEFYTPSMGLGIRQVALMPTGSLSPVPTPVGRLAISAE
jgi:hypothetical protein